MNIRAKRILCLASSLGLVLSLLTFPPASAAPAKAAAKAAAKGGKGGGAIADTAMSQFKARQYGLAAESFRKAIAADRANSTLYYYYALSLHYNNNIPGAMAIYNQIMQYFPGTDAAARAQMAMGSFGQAPAKSSPSSGSSSSSSSSSSSLDRALQQERSTFGTISGPDECNIRFERVQNSLIVDAAVNGRPIKMVFDTGAEMCAFGKNHLHEMGIPAPTGAPTGRAGGVGDGGVQHTWDVPATVTVGPITRKGFEITVQDNMDGHPLLGQTFFQDFTYTIDNGANNIHLRRKGAQQGSIYSQKNDPYAVPFTRMGKEIIVQAALNGRSMQMIFDTGAAVCAFTRGQVGSAGITVPEDAQTSSVQGIAGSSMASIFPVKSLKLGPIEKRDFEIHVVENAQMPAPLLGQTFYGDWQYTIDYDKQLIHFLRR